MDQGADSIRESLITEFNRLETDKKIDLLSAFIQSLKEKNDSTQIPVSIFNNDKLSTFECLVKYLKENLGMKFVKIASILNRSDKTIWATYNKSTKKMPSPFSQIDSKIMIPVDKLSDRKFTIFESLVGFLKDLGISNHEVGKLLQRDDRTIWSMYDKVKKKRNKIG